MNRWFRALYQPNLPLGQDGKRLTAGKEHIELSKNAAKEGMVLLKNDGGLLPLVRGEKIALFGKGTIDYVKGGGGSGDVTVPYVRNLAQGFALLGDQVQVFPDTIPFYEKAVQEEYDKGFFPGMIREPELPEELLARAAAFADTAIISLSRFSGEDWDRRCEFASKFRFTGNSEQNPIHMSEAVFERGDYYLSKAEEQMIAKVTAAFSRVVVVLNTGGIVDVSWFAENPQIPAVLLAWQSGMEGGLAEAEILCGLGNPSGKLADTFARDLMDYPSSCNFFESDDFIDYTDDIYVGYRYFETIPGAAKKVIYPFGYGLSYTAFSVTEQDARVEGDTVTVTALVCNTGSLPGREVVQVYYGAPQGKLGKPAKVLAGYRKTRLLSPGESQRVSIRFRVKDMASYDDLGKVLKSAWLLEAGTYRFYVGTSVRDTVEAGCWELPEMRVTEQLSPKMVPTALKERMLADGSMEALPQGTPNDPNASVLERMAEEDMEFPVPGVREQPRWQAFRKTESVWKLEDVADGRVSLDDFVAQLSEEDLAWLLGGQPNAGVANTFGFGGNPRFGIPAVMSADGPAGLRVKEETGVRTTAFPCATLLACTWDPAVTEQVGIAGSEEVKENNLSVWLTPAICIHRSPLCGRNFEYYSEDPLLTARQAGGMVKGIQSNHIATTVKHFALNNNETNRKNSDSRCSERAIREIYLKAFEILVKEYDPWGIMSSYNIINGHRASENAEMLKGILRDEWHFEGMVTSDWWTFGEHYKEVLAGNDVKMATGFPERLLAALEKGALRRADMELAAKHILGLILKVA